MVKDPQYRSLVDRHKDMKFDGAGGEMSRPEDSVEMISEPQIKTMINHVNQVIWIFEGKIKTEKDELKQHLAKNGLDAQLNAIMTKMLRSRMDVAEVYSPPRVAAMAARMGLRQGWSFNLTETRNRAVRRVLTDRPLVLVGSPMCWPFSAMNSINYSRMDPTEVAQRIEHGRKHFQFCAKLYRMQVEGGRYFLHEHPQAATSWREPCMQKLLQEEGVQRVIGDQCQYGSNVKGGNHEGPARKSTGFLTNSPCIARKLCKRCPNWSGQEIHKHIRLESGRAIKAQVYPDALCRAIWQGVNDQLDADRAGQFLFMNSMNKNNTTSKDLENEKRQMEHKYRIVEEDDTMELECAWDDVSGAALDPQKVKQARREEIEYVHKMSLHEKVPRKECVARTRRQPISARWIDINKGDATRPNYRSRLGQRNQHLQKRGPVRSDTTP